MSQSGWPNCPEPIRQQVNNLVAESRQRLSENLVGFYLHGSLTTHSHNPDHSDIDLLIVTRQALRLEAKRDFGEMLLRYENQPRQLELSLLTLDQLHPWRYPTPYDFHFGATVAEDLANGNWQHWNDEVRTDPDLAAHITLLNQRGLCLYGQPIAQTFPKVPAEHYRDSILLDFDWGLESVLQRPMYFILNACRILAYLREGVILSKDEGGQWGLANLPVDLEPTIAQALKLYRGHPDPTGFMGEDLTRFATQLKTLLDAQSK